MCYCRPPVNSSQFLSNPVLLNSVRKELGRSPALPEERCRPGSSWFRATRQPMTFAHFTIHARRDPQVLPRVLNFFAQIGEVPRRVVVEAAAEVTIIIEVAGLGDHQLAIIAEKMRSSFLVTDVEFSSSPDELPDEARR